MSFVSNLFKRFNSLFSSNKNPITEEVSSVATDYSSMKVSDLKAEAKSRGLKGYSSMRKADLVKLLGE